MSKSEDLPHQYHKYFDRHASEYFVVAVVVVVVLVVVEVRLITTTPRTTTTTTALGCTTPFENVRLLHMFGDTLRGALGRASERKHGRPMVPRVKPHHRLAPVGVDALQLALLHGQVARERVLSSVSEAGACLGCLLSSEGQKSRWMGRQKRASRSR